jgi:hypothetical protein
VGNTLKSMRVFGVMRIWCFSKGLPGGQDSEINVVCGVLGVEVLSKGLPGG